MPRRTTARSRSGKITRTHRRPAPEAANATPTVPPRSLRTATLSFGLVTVPVRFYTATSSQSPHFHLIHEQCGSRIKQQLFCPTCGRVVERNELLIREPMARLIRLTVKAATNTDRDGADDGEHPEAETAHGHNYAVDHVDGSGSAAHSLYDLPARRRWIEG